MSMLKKSKFFLCVQYLFKKTVILTLRNETECQTEGRIPMKKCLEINVYSFIYNNKL